MAGWLLWVMAHHPAPLWRTYLALLPAEPEMTCLLNFSQQEIEELQVPALKVITQHNPNPSSRGGDLQSEIEDRQEQQLMLLTQVPQPACAAKPASQASDFETPVARPACVVHVLDIAWDCVCVCVCKLDLVIAYVYVQAEAAHQASWCAHLHAKYFSAVSGSLAPLNLSHSLAHSLWAISLVRSRTFSGND